MYQGREGAEDVLVAKLASGGGGRKQSGLVCRELQCEGLLRKVGERGEEQIRRMGQRNRESIRRMQNRKQNTNGKESKCMGSV